MANPVSERMAAEEQVLQLLCQGVEGDSIWPDASDTLAGYHFVDPLHQVVFEVLRGIHSAGSLIMKERVQRAVVLAGFPALDAGAYFVPHGLSRAQARLLLSQLARIEGNR